MAVKKWMPVRDAWNSAWSRGFGPTKHVRRKGGYTRNARPLKTRSVAGEAALSDIDRQVLQIVGKIGKIGGGGCR
jgi:hypothetical protein